MFNILIVEDNKNTARLMEVVLTQNGYHTLHATDGEQALKILDETHVDLALVDIMMPVMDGITFTRVLRNSGSQIPIIMVTAKDSQEDIRKGFLTGTDDYMVKPIDEVELLLRIQALLRRAHIAADVFPFRSLCFQRMPFCLQRKVPQKQARDYIFSLSHSSPSEHRGHGR